MKDAGYSEEAQEGATSPVPRKMRPFVRRMKIKSRDLPRTAELRQAEDEMSTILKRIDPTQAANVVEGSLDAAANHQLARLRYEEIRIAQRRSLERLDQLIEIIERLAQAISALPLNSKGVLNLCLRELIREGHFDTEIFFGLIDRLQVESPKLSPQAKASKVLDIVVKEGGVLRELWETMPASTRLKTEKKMVALNQKPVVELMRLLPRILNDFRPPKPRGAPPSLDFGFVCAVDRIWVEQCEHTGLKGRRAEGPFHRFCNAALRGVGHSSEISSNQLARLRRKRAEDEARLKRLK